MEIKLNIGLPDGTTTQIPVSDAKALQGLKIGDTFKGELIDKTGYEFLITGGSNTGGVPMRKDVTGNIQRKVLLAGGVGYKPKRQGLRVRKSVAGNTIGPKTAQVNAKAVKVGKQSLTEKEGEEEAPAEE